MNRQRRSCFIDRSGWHESKKAKHVGIHASTP